jgi:hypothetical protein
MIVQGILQRSTYRPGPKTKPLITLDPSASFGVPLFHLLGRASSRRGALERLWQLPKVLSDSDTPKPYPGWP